MSQKKNLQNKLFSKLSRDGSRDLYSKSSGKIRYKSSGKSTYKVGANTITREENLEKNAAQQEAFKEAIRRLRNRISKGEEGAQTFAKFVRAKLEEDGRVFSGRLSRSLFSEATVALTTAEISDRRRLIPDIGEGDIQTEAQKNAILKKYRDSGFARSNLSKQFGRTAMGFAMGIELTLKALSYYESIDQGFAAGDNRFIPKNSREFNRLRTWVASKMANTPTIQAQDKATINLINYWKEEGREGDQTTEYALEKYQAYIRQEVRRELYNVLIERGLIQEMGAAEADMVAELMKGFGLQLAADFAEVQLAFAGAMEFAVDATALAASIAQDEIGGPAPEKLSQERIKTSRKTISRADQLSAELEATNDPEKQAAIIEELISLNRGI